MHLISSHLISGRTVTCAVLHPHIGSNAVEDAHVLAIPHFPEEQSGICGHGQLELSEILPAELEE
jgi:hypothetical protein